MEDMNIKDESLEHVQYAFVYFSKYQSDAICRINMLEHLNSAPSIGMHDVLRESLLVHLGFNKEGDTQDKLDE